MSYRKSCNAGVDAYISAITSLLAYGIVGAIKSLVSFCDFLQNQCKERAENYQNPANIKCHYMYIYIINESDHSYLNLP